LPPSIVPEKTCMMICGGDPFFSITAPQMYFKGLCTHVWAKRHRVQIFKINLSYNLLYPIISIYTSITIPQRLFKQQEDLDAGPLVDLGSGTNVHTSGSWTWLIYL
jgi:hypothetical protein